jgi:hypothetical protein
MSRFIRVLARIKPLAKLADMAMNGELNVIDGMDQTRIFNALGARRSGRIGDRPGF